MVTDKQHHALVAALFVKFSFPPSACLPLFKPEHGGYTCHPAPCRMFSHGTVIEFFCDDGFFLSGDYNYLTCQDGQWDGPMQISCVSQGWSVLNLRYINKINSFF